jgi:hypothetical protein
MPIHFAGIRSNDQPKADQPKADQPRADQRISEEAGGLRINPLRKKK